jgi:hypothetical protein
MEVMGHNSVIIETAEVLSRCSKVEFRVARILCNLAEQQSRRGHEASVSRLITNSRKALVAALKFSECVSEAQVQADEIERRLKRIEVLLSSRDVTPGIRSCRKAR